MAVVAFDPLEYAEQLEAAGMSRAQAEVVAKGLTQMFVHNFDALVTKDYLDTRFLEFESKMDFKLVSLESRMERQISLVETSLDKRISGVEATLERRFASLEVRFARVNVLLGVILAALAIPVIQTLLIWLR